MPIKATTLREVKKELANFSLKSLMKGARISRGTSMRRLSQQLGLESNFLTRNLKSNDVSIHLLLALSAHLRMNLLEPYLIMLPDELQETERERKLKLVIKDWEMKYEELMKEKEVLERVAMK